MTGVELLKEKLKQNYGISEIRAKQIIESKSCAMIIETLAHEDGLLKDLVIEIIKEQSDLLANKIMRERNLQCEIANQKAKLDAEKQEIEKLKAEFEEMEKRITAVETPEAKDRMRLYEIFKRDALIESSQNKSVYNAGLASILSGVPVWQFGSDGGDTDESIPVKRKNEKRNGTVRI